MSDRVALVSGANRGIGLAVAAALAERGLTVVAGARDAAAGERATATLRARGMDVRAHQLDVTDAASVERLAAWPSHCCRCCARAARPGS